MPPSLLPADALFRADAYLLKLVRREPRLAEDVRERCAFARDCVLAAIGYTEEIREDIARNEPWFDLHGPPYSLRDNGLIMFSQRLEQWYAGETPDKRVELAALRLIRQDLKTEFQDDFVKRQLEIALQHICLLIGNLLVAEFPPHRAETHRQG
jgi:hypothetical protein